MLAVELRNEGIRMWQWARSAVPAGLEADGTGGVPDPSAWGTATSDFPNTECDIGARFRNQSIVVNISLCGVWAGAAGVYGESCMFIPFLIVYWIAASTNRSRSWTMHGFGRE